MSAVFVRVNLEPCYIGVDPGSRSHLCRGTSVEAVTASESEEHNLPVDYEDGDKTAKKINWKISGSKDQPTTRWGTIF